MTVVPVSVQSISESDHAVRLARYAQVVGQPECMLWGVNSADDDPTACQKIWTHAQRVFVARYLGEAQAEIEEITGYPLSPKYFADEARRFQHRGIKTKWMKLLAIGIRAVANVQVGALVSHLTDPATITVVGVGALDPDEVVVYHPGTDAEITPSAVTVAAGTLTIEIPRCRLVLAALENTPADGLDYSDVLNFEATVDVVRVYTDDATQGTLVYPHGKSCNCGFLCSEETDSACVYIRDAELGFVDAHKASYAAGTWTPVTCTCGCSAQYVRLNYRAGLTELNEQAEDAIVRLAHSKMPAAPCGCETLNELWKRDRTVPDTLDRERLNCPFGLNEGAWIAWRFANALRTFRLGVI